MFTGIVTEIGRITHFSRYQKKDNLKVCTQRIAAQSAVGDSVSVNGACLTTTQIKGDILTFDLLQETMTRTDLGVLRVNDCVNLEPALRMGDKISGHFVGGHVDCTGTIRKKNMRTGNYCVEIVVPKDVMKYVIAKGAIAIDGISLTVVSVFRDSFTVYLIPHTMKDTILDTKGVGKKVNIECDQLAKYAAQHNQSSQAQ